MAAQNIGAGKWERVYRITWTGITVNILMTGLIVLSFIYINREVRSFFLPPEGKAIDIGVHINNITLWSFIIFGVFNVVAGVVRSAGSVVFPLIVAFIALLLVRIPLATVLSHKYGFDVIWWSFPVSFSVAATLNLLYYRFGKWKQARMMASQT